MKRKSFWLWVLALVVAGFLLLAYGCGTAQRQDHKRYVLYPDKDSVRYMDWHTFEEYSLPKKHKRH